MKRGKARGLEQVNLLELKPVRLEPWTDAMGSHAWKLLDGTRSVAEVATALRGEFGDRVEPAEERTGQLIRMLHHQRLLAYPGWDETPSGGSAKSPTESGPFGLD